MSAMFYKYKDSIDVSFGCVIIGGFIFKIIYLQNQLKNKEDELKETNDKLFNSENELKKIQEEYIELKNINEQSLNEIIELREINNDVLVI